MDKPEKIAADQICDIWCQEVGAKRPKHHAPQDGTIRERAEEIVANLLAAKRQ